MKKIFISVMAISMMFFLVLPALAGGPEETGRKWLERLNSEGIFPEISPEAFSITYVDLFSNAENWSSFLVITNWDFERRIRVITEFIPGDGTPSDIIRREVYVNPNGVVYLTPFDLGLNSYGRTNWFGVCSTDTEDWWGVGILLYHSEYGLTYIPGDGPYF